MGSAVDEAVDAGLGSLEAALTNPARSRSNQRTADRDRQARFVPCHQGDARRRHGHREDLWAGAHAL